MRRCNCLNAAGLYAPSPTKAFKGEGREPGALPVNYYLLDRAPGSCRSGILRVAVGAVLPGQHTTGRANHLDGASRETFRVS
jgi:hypothetical protein